MILDADTWHTGIMELGIDLRLIVTLEVRRWAPVSEDGYLPTGSVVELVTQATSLIDVGVIG